MNGNQNFNLECIKSVDKLGQTIYQNICDGTVNTVPWGSVNWISAIFMGLMIVAITFLTIFVVYFFFKMATEI